MTREEAIDLLQSRLDLIKKDYPDIADYAEALEMAIEALNQFAEDSKKVSISRGQENDLISRQALCEYALNQKDKSVTPNDIMRFPSAQPEIIRCKDCKYADDDGVCQNSIGLVIQDDDDFCSKAERR